MRNWMYGLFVALVVAGFSVDAHAGQRLRACKDKVQTLTSIVFAEVDEDCIPSETDYWLRLCPQDCWKVANEETGSQVCCNEYGTDDGIEDGSCVTRSAR